MTAPITGFPAFDLRPAQRFVTTHGQDGKGVFLPDDHGDHHRVILDGTAVCNIIYSTKGDQVNMNDEADVKHAKENEPAMTSPNGTIARLIDFAPGMVTPFHRAISVDYGVVIEGEFEMTLDSGEHRIMRPGDVAVNRACDHKWRNVSHDRSGRMLFVLLDAKPLTVNGERIRENLGDLGNDYQDQVQRALLNVAAAKMIQLQPFLHGTALR